MKKKLTVQDLVYSALFATLTAVLSYITIPLPFSPIPITGQSLAVMLAGLVLSPLEACLSMTTFLLMGIIGLPVFSAGKAGPGVIFGTSGGYLVGYLLGAVVISLLIRKNKSKILMYLSGFVGGIVVVHFFGVCWLSFISGMSLTKSFIIGSLPFLPGDTVKLIVAVPLAIRLNKVIKRNVQR